MNRKVSDARSIPQKVWEFVKVYRQIGQKFEIVPLNFRCGYFIYSKRLAKSTKVLANLLTKGELIFIVELRVESVAEIVPNKWRGILLITPSVVHYGLKSFEILIFIE